MNKFMLSFLLPLLLIGNVACKKVKETPYNPVIADEIHIGALLPLTGTGFSSGLAMQVSIEFARNDIMDYFNAAGIKSNLIIDIADTRTDTAEALKQLRMFYEKGIRMVVGPYSSAELSHIKAFSDAHGMLIVSPSSVAVSLAIPGDNVFRFVSSDLIQGKAMTKMISEDKIKVLVPLIRNDVWGNDLVAATAADFAKLGGTVHSPVKFETGTDDFSGVLNELDMAVAGELAHYNPNEVAVYLLSFAEGTKIIADAKNHTNLNNVYWYGGSAFAQNASMLEDSNATLFAYTHGLPCPLFGLDDAAINKWQPLRNRIANELGRIPDVYAITAYDALWVLVRTALTVGKNQDIELMKTAFIHEADDFFGASGNTQLDINGDRAVGNYDFWAVKSDSAGYCWKRVARYNSLYGTLVRLIE